MTEKPVLKFPRYIGLPAGHTYGEGRKEVGGVVFVDGRSTKPVAYRQANGIAAAFCPLVDLATGMMLSPLNEGVDGRYMVDWNSKFWNLLAAHPDHVAEQRRQIAERIGFDYDAPPPPAAVAPPAPTPAPTKTISDAELVAELVAVALKQKGAKWLRQEAVKLGLKPPRAGDETAGLVANFVTLAQAQALAEPTPVSANQ